MNLIIPILVPPGLFSLAFWFFALRGIGEVAAIHVFLLVTHPNWHIVPSTSADQEK